MNTQKVLLLQRYLNRFWILGLIILTCLQSCTTYKNVPYFTNIPDSGRVRTSGVPQTTTPYKDILIQPDDIIQVSIFTIDPQVASAMGLASQVDMVPQDALAANASAANIANRAVPGYLVDKDGYIELPVSGKVKVGGLTTVQARDQIRSKAALLYKDPVVNVRLANFRVTILGEVLRPGTYIVASERATILDALGLAGDMTIYGKRENVLLVRNEGGEQKMVRFDLNSSEIMRSPYYYMRQGDVLYVEPGKGKAAATDASRTRTLALIASGLSIILVIASRVNF